MVEFGLMKECSATIFYQNNTQLFQGNIAFPKALLKAFPEVFPETFSKAFPETFPEVFPEEFPEALTEAFPEEFFKYICVKLAF